jgi:hypothetical protein
MAAGKLVLLLLAGGLAGVAFAGMNAGAMRPFRDPARVAPAPADSALYAPAHRSWLDEGLSLLDTPAWPFGHGAGDEAPAPPLDDAAPYGYDRHDHGDEAPGYHAYDDRAYDDDTQDDAYAPGREADAPPFASDRDDPAAAAPPRSDAATDAASRAAAAAQDVIAAEHAN